MKKLASWGLFAAVIAGVWFLAGPMNLGGPASYVIVDGTSMEPTYDDGDLVITREQASYQLGDVITYDAPIDNQFSVIHRVVEVVEGGYVTQGDNRDEVDGWLAPADAVYGSTWVHIPWGGQLIETLRQPPVILSLLAAWLTLAYMNRRERQNQPRADSEDREHALA